jgi:predicted Zn-dependent protease
LAFVEAVCALKRVTRRMRNADSGAWRCLASAIEAQGGTGKARAAADEAVRIWARNYDAGNAVLEEARRYAQKLSQ